MDINNTAFNNENQFKLNTHNAMDNIQTVHNHEEFGQIRCGMQGDELWFLAKDVANALGYSDTNAMTRHLDADESISVKLTGMNMPHTVINEAGLYSAIIRSRVEGAKRFKRWITHEILPSIRKHGFYGTDDFIDNILSNPNGVVAFLEKYKDERQRRRLAEQQRNVSIKAINSKDRKINYLNWQLYERHTWMPVQDILWLKDFFNMDIGGCMQQIGRILSAGSRRGGFYPRKIAHPKFGAVNIYHEYVIRHFHRALIENPNYMKRFRKYPIKRVRNNVLSPEKQIEAALIQATLSHMASTNF